MNPASISVDTLTASVISIITSVIVGVMVALIKSQISKSEAARVEREEARAEREKEAAEELARQAALRQAEHDCLASMARAKLVTMASDYSRLGCFPFEARRSFDALYETYEAMGENGLIAETVDRARMLPMQPPTEGDPQ